MKKLRHKKLIIISLATVLVVVLVIWQLNRPDEYVVKRFIKELDAYDYVAVFCLNDYNSNEYTSKVFYSFTDDDNTLYCYADSRKIKLDGVSREFFQKVYENYYLDGQNLDRIVVNKGFVSFCNLNGREAYVYSSDGKTPKPGEISGIRTERMHKFKIVDNWYHFSSCDIGRWFR